MRSNPLLSMVFAIIFMAACNQGLAPPDKPTGFEGTIYYSNWDSAGSVVNLKLVVCKNYPPADIVSEVLSGEAKAYPPELSQSLPINMDSTAYTMEIEAGYYEYIIVAQQFGNNVYEDWRAVGQYDITPQDSLPAPVTIKDGEILESIDIFVDFEHLPIQPF